MGAPVKWFEINTSKPKAVRQFYAELFGWNLEVLEEANYALVDTGTEGAIGGGIGEAQGPNQVIFYIEVGDPQAYLDRIEQAGGKTVVPVTEIPDMVSFAQFTDPQGNVVGLVESTSVAPWPGPTELATGPWLGSGKPRLRPSSSGSSPDHRESLSPGHPHQRRSPWPHAGTKDVSFNSKEGRAWRCS